MPRLCFSAFCAVALVGCAGYQVGPTNGSDAGARSIQVNPFSNATMEPRLSASVTSALRERLMQDGTYRLNTRNSGDIIVSGTITDFNRAEVSLEPDDVLTPRDYRLSLAAHVKAIERSTGRVILDQTVAGRTTIRITADLSSAERQAVPLLADDLARNATALLVDGLW